MRRVVLTLCILSFPVLLFLNVFQSFRYERMSDNVRQLEKAQHDVVEENKRLIAGIAALGSPSRIEQIAKDQLDLREGFPEKSVTITISRGASDE